MDKKTKTYLILGGVMLAIMIAVGVWFYYKGKRQTPTMVPPLDLTNTGTNQPTNNPYAVSESAITQVAAEMHEDMDGFNAAGHDIEPFEKFASLSDTDFVKAYNAFNQKYYKESGETLLEWLESEIFAFDDVIDSIISRMGRLNLI